MLKIDYNDYSYIIHMQYTIAPLTERKNVTNQLKGIVKCKL